MTYHLDYWYSLAAHVQHTVSSRSHIQNRNNPHVNFGIVEKQKKHSTNFTLTEKKKNKKW